MPADTVARSSFKRTSTQPERTGRTALCHTSCKQGDTEANRRTYVYLLHSLQAHEIFLSLFCQAALVVGLRFRHGDNGFSDLRIQQRDIQQRFSRVGVLEQP